MDNDVLLTVQVVGEQNEPLSGAMVGLLGIASHGANTYTVPLAPNSWCETDSEGKVSFYASADYADEWGLEQWLIAVSAPGYLPARKVVSHSAKGSVDTVHLQRGRPLEIILRNETGKPLPQNLGVKVLQADSQFVALSYLEWLPTEDQTVEMRLHSQFGVAPQGEGRYLCAIPEEPPPLFVIVHHPGFLRGFWTVIDAELATQGQVEVRLPPTCTVHIQVDTLQAPLDWIPRFEVSLSTFMQGIHPPDERPWGLPYTEVIHKLSAGVQERLVIDDLAPGCHFLRLAGFPPQETQEAPSRELSGYFREAIQLNLQPDTPVYHSFVYRHPNPEHYRGDRTLRLTVRTSSGAPASHLPYALYAQVSQMRLRIAEGTLDSDGRATVVQLKPGKDYLLTVGVGEKPAQQPVEVSSTAPDTALTVVLPPHVGDPILNTPLYTLTDRVPQSLSAYRGKWLYVDFWATWCVPCQAALRQLREKLPTIRQQWQDELLIVTVSLDSTPEPAKRFLEGIGLLETGVHLWASEGYAVATAFGIYSIPTVLVVDPEGVVVWRGTPYELNLSELRARAQERPSSTP